MYAHGSHGRNRHKLCCSRLKLGLPRWFSLGFDLFTLIAVNASPSSTSLQEVSSEPVN